jgi:hypothetical protein
MIMRNDYEADRPLQERSRLRPQRCRREQTTSSVGSRAIHRPGTGA